MQYVNLFLGQPSHDPAHPDYRPQIFSNRHMDLQRLKKDLADWEKNKDKNPPVIQVQEKEVKHQKLILPKVGKGIRKG